MKAMKNTNLILCVIFTGVMTQNALALPSNSYVDLNGKNWQGYKSYTQSGYNVVLEWAVYTMAANPWAASVDFPAGDNYIYAYQLFNNSSTKDIGSFNLLTLEGDPIAQSLMHETQAVAVGQGVMPDPNPSVLQGEWKWMPGVGFVTAGKYSSYLIFSSVYAPVVGSFIVKTSEEGGPGGPAPEPATLALFGIASALYAAKRGRKRQAE